MYNKDSARKSKISWTKFDLKKKISANARGPLKIFDIQLFIFRDFQKNFQKWLLWDLSGIKRNKVKNFCEPSTSSSETAVGFMVVRVKLTLPLPGIGLT